MQTLCASSSSTSLFNKAPHPNLRIAITIPAKDEEECIISTLDALNNQLAANGRRLDPTVYEILILANNCTDDSYALVTRYRQTFPKLQLHVAQINLEKELAHVGTARRLLMDAAYERFKSIGRSDGIIVTTDADSEVDSLWIHSIMMEMAKGNDVVGGRILPRNIPKLSKLPHLRDVNYRYYLSRLESMLDPVSSDPWPRHFQCYGPSLAVTCSIYEKAGRIPPIPYLEDEEFRKALYRIDARVRRSPEVKVYTSARLQGKVEFGFSVQLKQWGAMTSYQQQQYAEPFVAHEKKLKAKNNLRTIWKNKRDITESHVQLSGVSRELMLNESWLKEQISCSEYFGQLWEAVELELERGSWRQSNMLQPISDVIGDFRRYFSSARLA